MNMKKMGLSVVAVVAVLVTFVAVWAANDTNVWPKPILERTSSPSVTLPEALRIAQEYVQTIKINVSRHYLYSVSLAVSDGKDYWYVKWLPTNP